MQDNNIEHIDQLFKDNLRDLQVIPPPEVWDAVAGQIPVSSPNRFRRIIAVAASLLFLFGTTWVVLQNRPDSDKVSEQGIEKQDLDVPMARDNGDVNAKASSRTEARGVKPVKNDSSHPSKEGITNKSEHANVGILPGTDENERFAAREFDPSATPKSISGKSFSFDGINTANLTDRDIERYSINPILMSTDVEVMNPNTISIDLADVKYGTNPKWGFGGNFSPLYSFRYTNPKTSQDMSYFHEKETGSYGFTGGMSAIYRAKRRLSIQTGVQFSRTGISLNELMFYKNIQTGRLVTTGILRKNIPYQFETSIGNVTSADNPHYLADFELPNGDLYTGNLSALPEFDKYEAFDASITQNFEFLEIPLLLRYKLIDRKFGMNVMSGIGTSFLVDNSVFMYYQDQKIPLGETEGLSKLNFAGTLGLGFEYTFNPKLSLNIEPTFKYFLNSFNKNSDLSVHPYFFGIYTGLNIYF